MITTDAQFKTAVGRLGFRRYDSRPQFCAYSAVPVERLGEGWFLMTGDSDGDMVDAMKDALSESAARIHP